MATQSWFVYILRCSDDTFYTGITTDLERRAAQHNGELPGGAKYTKARQPVSLVWQESQTNRSTASKREYAIKSMTHAQKSKLVSS